MTLDQALTTVRELARNRVLEPETVVLARAHGRVLARPVALPSIPGAIVSSVDVQPITGTVLTPWRIAQLARCGMGTVEVTRRPTVAVFTIGNALEPGLPPQGNRGYDGARDLLVGLLRADGFEPTAWPRLPAEPRQVEIALRDAGCAFDSIFVCGFGDALAQVRAVLETFGTIDAVGPALAGDDGAVFGTLDAACMLALPAEHTPLAGGYLTLGRQMLDGLHGRREARPVWRGRLAAAPGEAPFQRVRAEFGDGGALFVRPLSSDATAYEAAGREANALLVVPDIGGRPDAGAPVDVIPLSPQ